MILLRGGSVIDGTGAKAFRADVVLDGERIVDIIPGGAEGAVSSAQEVLDVSGCVVAPGFIDAHSHSDCYLLLEPDAPSKLSQGITTEINGQCGGSAFPRYGAARLPGDWSSMFYPEFSGGVLRKSPVPGPVWRSMKQYRRLFEAVRPSINSVQFVGHNTLRASVMGYEACAASPDALKAMCELLAEEMDEGAWGLTTGLIYNPGKYSRPEEVKALAETAACCGGYYATHMRSEGDAIEEAIDEVIDLVRATGVRAEISHLKTSGPANWHKIDAVLEKLQRAVDCGEIMGSDRYPYCAAGTELDIVFPDWAAEGGTQKELERLGHDGLRKKIVEEIDSSGRDWSSVRIGGTWSGFSKPFSGKTVEECAAELRKTPGEAVVMLVEADAGRTGGFFFGMSDDNLQKILSMPWVVAGSDASLRAKDGPLGADHPHPRAYGTMPAFYRRLVGRVPGRKAVCSREEAVSRMTKKTADRFGIADRGVLRKGAYADITVFDDDLFMDTATYDAPHSFSQGVEAVFVNGVLSFRKGRIVHAGAGKLLSHGN